MKRFPLFSLAGLVLSGLIFLPLAFSQTTNETLTISTYYPSPYGVYKELRLYPNTSPTTCDDLTEGNMYYNSTLKQVMVCKWTGGFPLYDWRTIDSLWTLNATSLYPNNTTWNVGIGTTGPLSTRLHIAGPASGAIKIEDGNQAAGRVLTSDVSGVGTWKVPGGGGGMSNVVVYSTPGSSSFTVPAGITKLWVEVYGGGGGGGGAGGISGAGGGGGGAGGVAMGFVTVTPGTSIPVTVGAWGVDGCIGSASGGTSSFSTLIATGGTVGYSLSSNWNQGGVGGSGSGGSINQRGGPGTPGIKFCWNPSCASPSGVGGNGGYNTRGVGGDGVYIGQEAGSIFGGGGGGGPSGCCGSCINGGAGGSGGVIIWY